jgi:alpha-L-fucosidase
LKLKNAVNDTHKHPELWEKFVKYTHSQITELLSDYGHIYVLWLDGGQVRPPDQDIRMNEIAELGGELQPGLIIADRTVGGKNENFITPEQTVPDEAIDFTWESCITMGPAFSYDFDAEYKPTRYLIHLLIDIVAKGGNLLLNIAPSPEGLFDEVALDRLREIGDWMAVNKEAIYGSRPIAPYKEDKICYTKKGKTVYALILADECKDLPDDSIILKSLQPIEGTSVMMLGEEEELSWKQHKDYVEVKLPKHKLPCNHAWVLKYKIKER